MRITLVSASFTMLALASCAANPSRPNDPSSETNTTGVSVEGGPATPGAIGGQPSSGGTTATSGAPASPMEGACPEGDPRGAASDRVQCQKSCRGYDDAVPVGSKCVSQFENCSLKCDAKFSSP